MTKKIEEETKVNSGGSSKVEITPTNPAASWEAEAQKGVEEASKKPELPKWDENANFGIRGSLENEFRVDGNLLGYEGKTVTLDGKPLIEAKNNVDGTTYTYSREDNVKALTDYGQKNGIVAARDYLTSTGIPMDIEWNGDNGTVNVNGYTVKPSYVIDGKAYVPQSVLDNIVDVTKGKTGIRTNAEILDEVNKKYGAEEQAAYDAYVGRERFSYNPEADEAYQAHLETAKRAIEDEYRNNMAAARFRTGGVASMGAMQQSAALREAAIDDIDAGRAAFEDRAYSRWQDEDERLYNEYVLSQGRRQTALNERIAANEADRGAWYDAKGFDSDQRMNNVNYETALWNLYNGKRNDDLNWGLDSQFMPRMYQIEASNAEIDNATKQLEYNIYDKYAEGNAAVSAGMSAMEFEKMKAQLKGLGYTDGQIAAIISNYYGNLTV